jgi:hypothetical protein
MCPVGLVVTSPMRRAISSATRRPVVIAVSMSAWSRRPSQVARVGVFRSASISGVRRTDRDAYPRAASQHSNPAAHGANGPRTAQVRTLARPITASRQIAETHDRKPPLTAADYPDQLTTSTPGNTGEPSPQGPQVGITGNSG